MRQIGEREQKNGAPATHALALPNDLNWSHQLPNKPNAHRPCSPTAALPFLWRIGQFAVVDPSTTSLRTIRPHRNLHPHRHRRTRSEHCDRLFNREFKFSTRPCALISVPQVCRYWQATACPRAAHKTATYRSPRSPTGSA